MQGGRNSPILLSLPYNRYWLYVYTHVYTSFHLVQATGLPECLFLTLLMRCPGPQPQHDRSTTQPPRNPACSAPLGTFPHEKPQQRLRGHIHQELEHKLSADLVQTLTAATCKHPRCHSFAGIIPKGARKEMLTPIASVLSGASTCKEVGIQFYQHTIPLNLMGLPMWTGYT